MSTARGLPSTHFWNRRASEKQFWENHGANKDFYLDQARGLPAVQSMLAEGKSPAQIRAEHPNLGNTLDAYYNPNNMIQVNRDANGNMSFLDDGKHRVLAAKELGLKVPVQIANDQAPSNVQSAAPVGKSAAQIRGERFEYEMDMLIESAVRGIPVREISIQTIYKNQNTGSHFRPFEDSVLIYRLILSGCFRYWKTSLKRKIRKEK